MTPSRPRNRIWPVFVSALLILPVVGFGTDTKAIDAGRFYLWPGREQAGWGPNTPGEESRRLNGGLPFQRVGRAPIFADLDLDFRDEIVLPTAVDAVPE